MKTRDEIFAIAKEWAISFDLSFDAEYDAECGFIAGYLACQQNLQQHDVSGCKELLLQMIEREQKYIDKCRSEGKGHEHSKGIIKGLEMAINVEENYHRLIAI